FTRAPPTAESTGQTIASAAGLADRAAEEVRRPERRCALLALDGERGRDQGPAGLAAMPELAPALGARRGQVGLELFEEAHGEPALDAERDPIAQGLAPFLLDPVADRLCHHRNVAPGGLTRARGGRPALRARAGCRLRTTAAAAWRRRCAR